MPRRCKAWRERFLAHREEVERIYDQRFVRMWEFYLAASEMAFREQDMMVFQIQLTKRQGVVPMTRDYISARGSAPARARRQAAPAAAARRRIARSSRLLRVNFVRFACCSRKLASIVEARRRALTGYFVGQ